MQRDFRGERVMDVVERFVVEWGVVILGVVRGVDIVFRYTACVFK